MNFIGATEGVLNTTSDGAKSFIGIVPSMSSDALLIYVFPSYIIDVPIDTLTPHRH
jgi:hypothetical protein